MFYDYCDIFGCNVYNLKAHGCHVACCLAETQLILLWIPDKSRGALGRQTPAQEAAHSWQGPQKEEGFIEVHC